MPLFVNETFAINAVVRFRVLKSWQSSADHCKSLPYTYILAQYSRCSPFNCVKDEKWSHIMIYVWEKGWMHTTMLRSISALVPQLETNLRARAE